MKIAIMGYSGSGKSTLGRELAETFQLPLLHLDTVQFLPDWEERAEADKLEMVRAFLDGNPEDWVIDGNYTGLHYERRLAEADRIILLLFGRLNCLWRCTRRFRRYRGTTRPDMAEGCKEKLDWEFVKWILRDGRTAGVRERYRRLQSQYPDKVIVVRNQRQLNHCREQIR